jgi:hypothetical protein
MILMDWQRGKIPYFVPPPKQNGENMENKDNMDVEVVLDDKNKKYNIDQNVDELVVTNEYKEENKVDEN